MSLSRCEISQFEKYLIAMRNDHVHSRSSARESVLNLRNGTAKIGREHKELVVNKKQSIYIYELITLD